jgi:5-methylcytosine-specific restriction endonuclease McrA
MAEWILPVKDLGDTPPLPRLSRVHNNGLALRPVQGPAASPRNVDRPIAAAQVAAFPRCAVCGTTEDLTADHVIPPARGGTNDGKRQTLWRSCNSSNEAR